MTHTSIIRYVCKRKVIFTEGVKPNFSEDCTEMGISTESWPDLMSGETDYGGWYELHPSNIIFSDEDELKFHATCNRLYSVFSNFCTAFRLAAWTNIDLKQWADNEIETLVETMRSAISQKEWPSLEGHKISFLGLVMRARNELAIRRGYDIKSSRNYGFVYLVKSSTGHYKIGKSINPQRRITEFIPGSVILPIELTLEHVIESDNYHKVESGFHDLYASKRFKGEWFSLTEKDIENFKSLTVIIYDVPPKSEAVA